MDLWLNQSHSDVALKDSKERKFSWWPELWVVYLVTHFVWVEKQPKARIWALAKDLPDWREAWKHNPGGRRRRRSGDEASGWTYGNGMEFKYPHVTSQCHQTASTMGVT